MSQENVKGRDISILEYFKRLQLEYLLYELRAKIYPARKDRARYHEVLDFKREKIEDISNTNELDSIFTHDYKLKELKSEFYNEFGNPKGLSNRDKYFYYYIGSDFSYQGSGARLIKYDLNEGIAEIDQNGDIYTVDITEIKRIL